ncbi:MAG: PD-(D/E)XK nuclease family protein, partial [Gammaproteobacteria bacterium]
MIRLPQDVTEAIEQAQTVVVPSRQRSEAVRLAYAATALTQSRSVWHTPDVLPLDAWKAREIERRAASGETLPRLLTPAEDWLLWRQSTTQLTDGLELVARAPLAEALRRSSQLAHEFRIDVSKLPGLPGSETRMLFNVEQAVAEKTKALGAASAPQLAASLTCLGGGRSLVLAGFAQATPSLTALIASRRDQGCVTRLRAAQEPGSNVARAVFASDTSEELERIADWCRTRLAEQPDARLLVLVPGAPEARERLVTLIRQNVDPGRSVHGDLAGTDAGGLAAIEGGLPLSRAPLAAHALRALAWLTGGTEFAEFSAWLCSPYWALPDTGRARLDLWLRERAALEMDSRTLLGALGSVPSPLAKLAPEMAAQIQAALRELGSGRASPRQWSERFDGALAALQWPGSRPLDSDEEQTRARFTELLDDFGQLAAVAGQISRDTAVQWLGELATRTSFRPASGDALVTVSSQLMDPITHYDGIWAAGLHADAWPQPVQPDPFLPLAAQIAAGVPQASSTGRAAEANALLAAWRSCTPELVMSAPLRAEDVQLSPSPFLAQYAANSAPATAAPSLWLPLRLRREALTELIDDGTGVPWDVSRPLPSGARSVELQNLCPFRAYAELRLGSTPMDAPEPGVAADLRGKLLHTALERLWSVLGGSEGLQARSKESLEALIGTCVEEAAFATMGPAHEAGRPAAERRECRRAARLIQALCELERTRPAFLVQEAEIERTLRLAGAQLRLRIDRLDALGTGGLAILDYKSGRPISGDWYSERPSHPQLLAYLAAVGDEVLAMATVTVTAREIRFDGVASDGNLLPKVRGVEGTSGEAGREAWELRRREWHARIEQLAADFLAGRAAVDPRPKACQYCHVVSVCR